MVDSRNLFQDRMGCEGVFSWIEHMFTPLQGNRIRLGFKGNDYIEVFQKAISNIYNNLNELFDNDNLSFTDILETVDYKH